MKEWRAHVEFPHLVRFLSQTLRPAGSGSTGAHLLTQAAGLNPRIFVCVAGARDPLGGVPASSQASQAASSLAPL
eukprot:5480621-Pyramimonas_sp.AAC.1